MGKITSDEQLKRWVDGDSIHRGTREYGTCCPDFSCCTPRLLADAATRQAFVAASESQRHKFLMVFLGAAIAEAGESEKVHLAGKEPAS